MYLYTVIDSRTMKRHWCFGGEGCGDCLFRFECFTDDRIHVKPVKIDLTPEFNRRKIIDRFKAEFHLPKCLRLGLYKQVADNGYWNKHSFKLGEIIEEDENIGIERSWVKFPNILYVTGTIRR